MSDCQLKESGLVVEIFRAGKPQVVPYDEIQWPEEVRGLLRYERLRSIYGPMFLPDRKCLILNLNFWAPWARQSWQNSCRDVPDGTSSPRGSIGVAARHNMHAGLGGKSLRSCAGGTRAQNWDIPKTKRSQSRLELPKSMPCHRWRNNWNSQRKGPE
jgi:hypothetical protein